MFSNSKWFSNFYRLFIGQGLATLLTTTVNYCLIFYLTDKFKSASLLTIAQLVSLIPIALFLHYQECWSIVLIKKCYL